MEWWNFNFFKKSIDGSYDDVEHLKWKLKMSLFINHSAPNASGTFPFVKMDFFNFWSKSVHLRSKWLVFERFWAIFEQKYEISRNHKNRLKSPILTLRCLKWAQMSEDWFIILQCIHIKRWGLSKTKMYKKPLILDEIWRLSAISNFLGLFVGSKCRFFL